MTSSSAAACPSGGLCGPGAGDMEGGFWGLHVGSSQQRTSTEGLHACNVGHIQGPRGLWGPGLAGKAVATAVLGVWGVRGQ